MDKEIKDLLENEVLGDEAKSALQEAFDNKVKAVEQKLHEDYAARYSHDKAVLVEAMDKMLTDAIRSELTEFAEDRSAMIQQRAKLSKSTLEAKRNMPQRWLSMQRCLIDLLLTSLRQSFWSSRRIARTS